MRQAVLLVLIVLPGAAGVVIFGLYALQDWAALQVAYRQFAVAVQQHAGMQAVFTAEATQNIHRINLFADGVWALLSAIYLAIGVHGLCILPNKSYVAPSR